MLPTSSFAAFVSFHHEFNTFGYTKSFQNFTGGYNDDGRISRNPDNFLGYFTLRSCDEPTLSIVVQLNGRIPFSHVLLNATQASLAGLSEGQEVILEHVGHTVCKSVEIIPLTPHDFHILDSNSSIVEEELLQQISIVKKGMVLPFWLSPSVSALFRIGLITPDTDLPVILHNSSELHIAPVSSSALSSPSIGSPSTGGVSMEKVIYIPNLIGQLNLFRGEEPVDFVSRCLPRETADQDKGLSDILENHPSLILTLYSGNYTICDIVKVTTASDLKRSFFSILVRIPRTSSSLEGVLLSAQNILKNKMKSSLCSHLWSLDYVRFHTAGLFPKRFHELSSVLVEIKGTDKEDFPEKKLRSHLLSQAKMFPVVLGHGGILYSFHIDGEAFGVRLCPSERDLSKSQDSKETCFAVVSTTRIEFLELEKESENLEETSLDNFGFATTSLSQFEFQDHLTEESEKLINYHFSRSQIPARILILGATGSGKSALLTRIARNLAHSDRTVFSLYIDCNTWKGKQAENIEKTLKGEIKKLEVRRPSALFLDNLDFFQLQNEDEQRQIGIEKIFHGEIIQEEAKEVAFSYPFLHRQIPHAAGRHCQKENDPAQVVDRRRWRQAFQSNL